MTPPPLPFRTLPANGQRLPVFGLGGAALGNLYAAVSEADARATYEAAWAEGLRLFDTAPYYGHGLSEARLGRFLASRDTAGAIVCSKVGRSLRSQGGDPAPDTGFVDAAPFVPYFDYSGDAVRRQIEGSLERLGVNRLDIVFVHDIGQRTHGAGHAATFDAALKGAFPALLELKAQGVVGAIGIGVNEVEVCLETLRHIDLDAILLAGRFTLLDQSALAELLPLCLERRTGVIIGGPFNSGVLAGGEHYDYGAAPAPIVERTRRLRAACEAAGVSIAAAALHYPLLHPAVVSVIPGARSAAEVRANAGHMRASPPPGFWDALRAQGLIPDRAIAA
jgi:D-threo-aldose 1-dehydrogenase